MNLNIFSHLRKPGLVPGESLSLSAKIYSVLEKYPCFIPQDVLKMISGHVVTKNWHVENAVSTPILFLRIFLENSHNNKMSYKYLHLIRTCIFSFIQLWTRVLVCTLTHQFNRIFVPFVFCLSEFCMNIFISIFTQYCPHFTFKKLIKNCTWSVII